MPKIVLFSSLVLLIFASNLFSQNLSSSVPVREPAAGSDQAVFNIADNVARMASSVEQLTRLWKGFAESFSTNQGLKLDERQQKLILALEVLNRIEQSLANMIKLRIELVEKQSKIRLQLAGVTDDLLPQSIDRYVAMRGTTDAEAIRDIRRQALTKEHRELTMLLSQIQRELDGVNDDIKRTEAQVRFLRSRIFGEIEKELADF